MSLMDELALRAKESPKRVVFPEGSNPTVIEAARKLAEEGYAKPILLWSQSGHDDAGAPAGIGAGSVEEFTAEVGDTSGNIEIVEVGGDLLREFIVDYAAETGFPEAVAESFFIQPLFFGATMVKRGLADAMVAGVESATEDVIMASEMIIGLAEGNDTPSSFFLMDVPGWVGGEGSLVVFADCAVNPAPTSAQLADIAVATAQSARSMFEFEPRVALLSFSTKGSADHADVKKVTDAMEHLRQRNVDFAVDGELQADTAVVEAVAAKKVGGDSAVAGKANILIFPDLDAGNIAYKLVQRLAGAAAYGPVLQGFAKPVSDLSRGASVEDIVGSTIMASVQ